MMVFVFFFTCNNFGPNSRERILCTFDSSDRVEEKGGQGHQKACAQGGPSCACQAGYRASQKFTPGLPPSGGCWGGCWPELPPLERGRSHARWGGSDGLAGSQPGNRRCSVSAPGSRAQEGLFSPFGTHLGHTLSERSVTRVGSPWEEATTSKGDAAEKQAPPALALKGTRRAAGTS